MYVYRKDASKAIAAVAEEWKKYNTDFPFSYAFLDDAYQNLYIVETRTGTLYNGFSGIAISYPVWFAWTGDLYGWNWDQEIGVKKSIGRQYCHHHLHSHQRYSNWWSYLIVIAIPFHGMRWIIG